MCKLLFLFRFTFVTQWRRFLILMYSFCYDLSVFWCTKSCSERWLYKIEESRVFIPYKLSMKYLQQMYNGLWKISSIFDDICCLELLHSSNIGISVVQYVPTETVRDLHKMIRITRAEFSCVVALICKPQYLHISRVWVWIEFEYFELILQYKFVLEVRYPRLLFCHGLGVFLHS